jgi:hypothetical protein
MFALRHSLRAELRNGSYVRCRYAVDDDGSVPLRAKDRDDERRRGCQARAPSPGAAPARDACEGSAHVGLPPLPIARLGDEVDDPLDLAFAANLRKAAAASGEMFSIGVTFFVAGLSESDRTGQYLGRGAV